MPRLRMISTPGHALLMGPIWEPGEERDLSDEEAAPYLTNVNWQVVPTELVDAPPDPPVIEVPAPFEQL